MDSSLIATAVQSGNAAQAAELMHQHPEWRSIWTGQLTAPASGKLRSVARPPPPPPTPPHSRSRPDSTFCYSRELRLTLAEGGPGGLRCGPTGKRCPPICYQRGAIVDAHASARSVVPGPPGRTSGPSIRAGGMHAVAMVHTPLAFRRQCRCAETAF